MAYVYNKAGEESKVWQKELYDSLIKHTGLKGNRAEPLASANLQECRETAMPAVLLELGFMDSKTDTPVILTEKYADACAAAIVEVLVKKGKLTPKPTKNEGKLYRVQAGAFKDRANAEGLVSRLKAKGFEAIIVEEN